MFNYWITGIWITENITYSLSFLEFYKLTVKFTDNKNVYDKFKNRNLNLEKIEFKNRTFYSSQADNVMWQYITIIISKY